MDKLRVIQWTTGKVGKLSMRAILDDPSLELAGVYAHSPDKVGVDAGDLCGRPATGVVATDDIDALVALKADTVLYTPFMADLGHAIRLLETGHDVISTNLFLNVGGIEGEVRDQLEAAGRRGNASLYISGVNPGWINSVATAITAVCRDVQSVSIVESANCASYESPETWTTMGMGMRAATPEVVASARNWLVIFRDAVVRVADGLDLRLDDLEFDIEFATAARRIDLGWFCMEKDTHAAVRAYWNGKVGGRTVVQSRITWYLTKDLNEAWEIDDDHYHVVVEGEPGVDMRLRFKPPTHWGNHEWDTMTALPAVNAVHQVRAARAGVIGVRDAGLPYAPVGRWMGQAV
jgi:hypothetical protein